MNYLDKNAYARVCAIGLLDIYTVLGGIGIYAQACVCARYRSFGICVYIRVCARGRGIAR